jgi:hypothetical protein
VHEFVEKAELVRVARFLAVRVKRLATFFPLLGRILWAFGLGTLASWCH